MCWAVISFNLWNGAALLPPDVPPLSCLDRNTAAVARNEIVFFMVIYEFSVEEELSIDFTEPANKFVAFEFLSRLY
jgi:hypothetical protein